MKLKEEIINNLKSNTNSQGQTQSPKTATRSSANSPTINALPQNILRHEQVEIIFELLTKTISHSFKLQNLILSGDCLFENESHVHNFQFVQCKVPNLKVYPIGTRLPLTSWTNGYTPPHYVSYYHSSQSLPISIVEIADGTNTFYYDSDIEKVNWLDDSHLLKDKRKVKNFSFAPPCRAHLNFDDALASLLESSKSHQAYGLTNISRKELDLLQNMICNWLNENEIFIARYHMIKHLFKRNQVVYQLSKADQCDYLIENFANEKYIVVLD